MVVQRTKRKERAPARPKKSDLSVWERLAGIGESIPPKERARLPRDGARYFDHYLDGSSKED